MGGKVELDYLGLLLSISPLFRIVLTLTDMKTDTQTDTTENNATLAVQK